MLLKVKVFTSPGCSVKIIQHANYQGVSQVYRGVVGRVSRNNDMSSLKLQKGCCVTIYQGFNWKGTSKRYCGVNVGFVGGAWNDKMSSLRVTGSKLFYVLISVSSSFALTKGMVYENIQEMICKSVISLLFCTIRNLFSVLKNGEDQ